MQAQDEASLEASRKALSQQRSEVESSLSALQALQGQHADALQAAGARAAQVDAKVASLQSIQGEGWSLILSDKQAGRLAADKLSCLLTEQQAEDTLAALSQGSLASAHTIAGTMHKNVHVRCISRGKMGQLVAFTCKGLQLHGHARVLMHQLCMCNARLPCLL